MDGVTTFYGKCYSFWYFSRIIVFLFMDILTFGLLISRVLLMDIRCFFVMDTGIKSMRLLFTRAPFYQYLLV
jgi:hypothetical protein